MPNVNLIITAVQTYAAEVDALIAENEQLRAGVAEDQMLRDGLAATQEALAQAQAELEAIKANLSVSSDDTRVAELEGVVAGLEAQVKTKDETIVAKDSNLGDLDKNRDAMWAETNDWRKLAGVKGGFRERMDPLPAEAQETFKAGIEYLKLKPELEKELAALKKQVDSLESSLGKLGG